MPSITSSQTSSDLPGRGKVAVVSGASSGIGRAAVFALAEAGWSIWAVARRADRLEEVSWETGATARSVDVTDRTAVEALAREVHETAGRVDALLNISGAAFGADAVAEGDVEDWRAMFELNVLGTLNMVQAFLPALRENGRGTVMNLTSTAAEAGYEGGGGYNAAKFGERALTEALRLEEAENGLRVIEIRPGMVRTEEFSKNRLGSEEAAAKVYRGVEEPLTAEDVADVIAYSVNLPHHVNLDHVTLRPVAQAAQYKVIRKDAE